MNIYDNWSTTVEEFEESKKDGLKAVKPFSQFIEEIHMTGMREIPNKKNPEEAYYHFLFNNSNGVPSLLWGQFTQNHKRFTVKDAKQFKKIVATWWCGVASWVDEETQETRHKIYVFPQNQQVTKKDFMSWL